MNSDYERLEPEVAKKINVRIVNQFFTVLMLLGVVTFLFVSWDTAGRNSFELLSVIHRLELLPEFIPTKPILMWWVLMPVFLMWCIKETSYSLFQTFKGRMSTSQNILLFPVLISSALLSYAVTLSPTATRAPSWCLGLSVAGILAVLHGFLLQRETSSLD